MKYQVFNKTDGIFAQANELTLEQAKKFVRDYRQCFVEQGFYRTADGQHIKPEDIELEIQEIRDVEVTTIGDLVRQRDQLLKALKAVLPYVPGHTTGDTAGPAVAGACARGDRRSRKES